MLIIEAASGKLEEANPAAHTLLGDGLVPVASALGRGTTFRIALPTAVRASQRSAA